MDLQNLNIELFKKLAFALMIIRNTPKGIRSDVFARSLAKRLCHRSNIIDEYLVRRQDDLLSRLDKQSDSKLTTSISMMDLTNLPNGKVRFNDQYGLFADKVLKLKERKRLIKIDDIEILLDIISKWLTNNQWIILPIDACLYTIQLIANHLKTDNDKPYHLILDLLPLIDKFFDCLFDILEQINETHVDFIHEMIISLSSSNSCVSRMFDKIFTRICHLSEQSTVNHDESIDRLFRILHDIVHNRSIYQARLSQRSIEKIYRFLNQISPLLDGKSTFTHTLKLQGQLQAGNYKLIETKIQTYPSYTSSSSSSDHSQIQQQKYFNNNRMSSKMNNLDYSMSQSSQYF